VDTADATAVEETLGVVLKAVEDIEAVRAAGVADLVERARARASVAR
jgi:hypothetical protein